MWAKTYNIVKTYMGRLPYESDLSTEINKFCVENNIRAGQISIIGALKSLKLGFYQQDKKSYVFLDEIKSDEPFEIASCSGNVSIKDGNPFAHVHIVASDRNGNCYGGHVMQGTTIFAGEFIIHVFEGEDLIRGVDEETKLPLWVK